MITQRLWLLKGNLANRFGYNTTTSEDITENFLMQLQRIRRKLLIHVHVQLFAQNMLI